MQRNTDISYTNKKGHMFYTGRKDGFFIITTPTLSTSADGWQFLFVSNQSGSIFIPNGRHFTGNRNLHKKMVKKTMKRYSCISRDSPNDLMIPDLTELLLLAVASFGFKDSAD